MNIKSNDKLFIESNVDKTKISREWSFVDAPNPAISGVYLLIIKERIYYVGKSVNIFARLAQHKERREYEKAMFIEAAIDDLCIIEMFFIKRLIPKWNVIGVKQPGVSARAGFGVWIKKPGRTPHYRHAIRLLKLFKNYISETDKAKKQYLKVMAEICP